MTDDARAALDNHLLANMEAELVTTRAELARAAAHNADMEAELFEVAQRLSAKEAEHEAALNALKKIREELFEARSALEQPVRNTSNSIVGAATRTARTVLRSVRR